MNSPTIPAVFSPSGNISMTSKDISDLVEKRHDNVKRTIETLIEKGVIQLPQIVEVREKQSLSPNNKSTAYLFAGEHGKRDSIIVVAQLSPEFTARLVDRWQELESKHRVDPVALLNDPATLKQLLLANLQTVEDQKLQIEQRDKVIAITSPKAKVADRLMGAEGNLNIRNAAKALKMKEHKFTTWLQITKHAFRYKKGRLEGYAHHVPRYLDHKVEPIPIEGNPDRVSFQMMITPEGLVRFAKLLNVELYEQEFDFKEAA